MMSKNIILCSDGTGNKGGHGADTNVFRLFNAVDIHNISGDEDAPQQITFYDDGVGTSKNKYLKAIAGAFGFGFERNVLDLYEFLARRYDVEKGDNIYLFGFSRGAATVRAFAGMVQECGLLDIKNSACEEDGRFNEKAFQEQLENARDAYRQVKSNPSRAAAFKREMGVSDPQYAPGGNVPIKMIGVWDTVSALGFPQDWPGGLDYLFRWFDRVSDSIWPHNYYNYQLNKNVLNVHHALAIDDERQTFFPRVWSETRDDRPVEIEQVWFAGVHSNVGGGYPRAGLSMVAYDWMMTRAIYHGIRFIPDAHRDVRAAANVNGRLYDSRAGAAIYYRYGPRDITELCTKVSPPIKIHESAVERLDRGTARYAPRSIPFDVEVVGTDIQAPGRRVSTAPTQTDWNFNHSNIWRQVKRRKVLYRVFVEATLLLVIAAGYLWIYPPLPICETGQACTNSTIMSHVADVLNYVLPDYFEGSINFVTIMHPEYLFGLIAFFAVLRWLRNILRGRTHDASEIARHAFLEQLGK
jgi:uncharacterized protein (DUF2235 family)